MFRQKILLFLACAISTLFVAKIVDKGKIMTPEITAPYFSGAALNSKSEEWIFNLNEVDSLKSISNQNDKADRKRSLDSYRFSDTPDSIHSYKLNQPGLLYVIIIAKKIFFFQGDIGALKSLQLLLHIVFSFLILINLNSTRKKLLFYFFYFINPAIIYLTIFPFYYFWQVIGSYIIVLIWLNKKYQTFLLLILSATILAGVFHIRVSTLPLSLFILAIGFYTIPVFKRAIAIAVFLTGIFLMQPKYLSKHPGHVMYSSLGAYPDSPVKDFSDNISFDNFSAASGKKYSYESTPSMYDAEVIMGEAEWGMKEFIKFAKEHPFIIIRNAALNLFQSFSIGYITSSSIVTAISFFTGIIFFLMLLARKKYLHIILILASTCSYILYLAPVPIYLYGTYVILVYSFTDFFARPLRAVQKKDQPALQADL